MGITLSGLSDNPTLFKKIINSDDFIKKIFTVTSSLGKNPLGADNQPKPTRSCSLESIDSAYESDSGEVYSIKCLSSREFYEKVNQLKISLYEKYSPIFLTEQDTDSLIKENRVTLDQYKHLSSEKTGYANFLYRDIKIPGINNKSQKEKREIIKNFALPKPLTNKKGSMLPLKNAFIQEPIRQITRPSEGIKYKKNTKFNKQLVYIHYKTCEKNPPNQRVTPLPKSTFAFNGNIPQTNSSLLRAKHIKENYYSSSQSANSTYNLQKKIQKKSKPSIENLDLTFLEKNIKKEKKLTQELSGYIKKIEEIQSQIDTNNRLLQNLKSTKNQLL
ncbi:MULTISPECIES: hypothetical protein [Providencia]|uniref:hypothetical protein n=1 Tax=Providencia TaxID=586 RepID=UPI00197FB5CE|nr:MULTISPECIES: hypothetical protein [Providencia]MBN4865860.1 hypothetical protein [Providencia stuartii]MBN4875182.1 hypothetical protein [Providencia stuartii]MBN4879873.1 hypothetical protein [Providencia stuartii]MBN4884606.1 hypothetical protein [Providencia stuartii]